MIRFSISYFFWHYTKAYKELFLLTRNILWFVLHLFSIRELLQTFFQPWQRLGERYRGGFNVSAWFESFVVNMIMRLVGIAIRTIMIVLGVGSFLFVLGASVVLFFVWTLLPLILLFLFVTTIKLFLANNNG